MPTLPADEDYARALLSIFGARRLLPQQSLRLDDARASFLRQNMGRAHDFEAALDYATLRGWLWAGFGSVRLTRPGDDEMQTIWPGRGDQPELDRRGPPAPSVPIVKPNA
jgi:hypothetical protein